MTHTSDPAPNCTATATEHARQAYLRACALDVEVRKPGNVSQASPGHGMQAAQFIASAQASAPALFRPGASLGARIEGAVRASWDAVGCNTNLGIVLLCAPIALAVERCPQARTPEALCAAIDAVLAAADVTDTAAVYRAIAHARPGGLGHAPREDVHTPPTLALRDAMALAADRDSIAQCYRDGYAALADTALATLGPDRWHTSSAGDLAMPTPQAVLRCHLTLLAQAPDSHIARKHGLATAKTVQQDAARWCADPRLAMPEADLEHDPAYITWDETLKAARINPGTTADLTVATMLLAAIGCA